MKPPRMSTAGLMLLVIAVAANFAAARAIDRWTRLDAEQYWFVVAPFGSTLLFALPRVTLSRGPARLFWGGFLVLGSMALASFVCCIIDPASGSLAARLWNGYGTLIGDGLAWAVRLAKRLPRGADTIVWVLAGTTVYLPQLAVALAGGLIARTISKAATRRRESVAIEGGEPDRPPSLPGRTRAQDGGPAAGVR